MVKPFFVECTCVRVHVNIHVVCVIAMLRNTVIHVTIGNALHFVHELKY